MERKAILAIVGVLILLAVVVAVELSAPLGLLMIVVAVVLAVLAVRRAERGDPVFFPAVRNALDDRRERLAAENTPPPPCWRCGRQSPPGSDECVGCGASLTA